MSSELFPKASTSWWFPAGGALIAGICLARRQLLLAILGMVFFYQSAFFSFSGPLENYKPVVVLAEKIQDTAISSDYELGYYRFTAPSLRFYSDRNIHEIYDLEKATHLLLSFREVHLITDQAGLDELRESTGGRIRVTAEGKKISSRLRTLISRLRNQTTREDAWSSPVYLVSNRMEIQD